MAEEFTETYSMDILSVLSEISDKMSQVIGMLDEIKRVIESIERQNR